MHVKRKGDPVMFVCSRGYVYHGLITDIRSHGHIDLVRVTTDGDLIFENDIAKKTPQSKRKYWI